MTEPNLSKNSLDLYKGDIREGMKLFAWDAIQDCFKDKCPVVEKCGYIKRGKCAVHVNYIQTLTDTIATSYKYLDEIQYWKIGMQIIPLYSNLLRLKLLEMSLTDLIVVTPKGIKIIHPVYKEIRQTLLTIHMMWKDLEITPHIIDPTLTPAEKQKEENDKMLNGDATYYDQLCTMDQPATSNGLRKRKIR